MCLTKPKIIIFGNVLQGFRKLKYMELSSTSRIYGSFSVVSFWFGLIVEMKLYAHWSLLAKAPHEGNL